MRARVLLTYSLFLVSGATGLLYEVAFAKVLATIFGATAYAISTVLSAFMAGLALGSWIGGRFAHKVERPLVAYGVAEILVGLLAACTPFIFDALEAVYLSLASSSFVVTTVVRSVLTFLAILIPTTCMGATLPILSRTAKTHGPSVLPRLYAINTIGGATGSLLSAYLVLPALGIQGTMWATALINLTIGVIAIVAGRRGSPVPVGEAADVADVAPVSSEASQAEGAPAAATALESKPFARELLLFAFASGYLVFMTEVVETHLLSLLIGNSAYAFGLMLAVFLLCLGVGAARATSLVQQREDSAEVTAVGLPRGLALTALLLVLTIPLWDQLPHFFSFAGKLTDDWATRELCRGLAAFAILVLPTLYMGTTFPLLLTTVAKRSTVAKDVARLTIANTSGTILGAIITGYVVLPALGSQRTLQATALVFAGLAFVALSRPKALSGRLSGVVSSQRAKRVTIGLAGAAALLALVLPRWDLARMTNGANVYFTHGPPPDEILFVREDVHGGVTTVARRGELLTMYTNGKFQGDNGPEMSAQRHFAHFPALFLKEEKRALVVGLGTGVTLGTVAAYPFETIELAEISPSIVDAARLFYQEPARGALDDTRVNIALNDGRNVLLVEAGHYDLITIELTSVWFAGASNLYSVEFYELCKSRLTQEGVLQQWVQLHHIRPRELAAIVRTLRKVFPHVALFEGGSQGILVASQSPLVASRSRLERLDALPAIRETMEGAPLSSLIEELILSNEELDSLTADIAKQDGKEIFSTDDNLFLEYATPKGNVLDYRVSLKETLELLHSYRTHKDGARHLGD